MIPIKTKEMLLIQRSAEKTKPNYRKWKDRLFQASLFSAMSVCAVLTFSLIVYVAIKAVPNINLDFLLGQPSYIEDTIGILPAILNTLYLLLGTLLFVVPLGVGAAIYLNEYCKSARLVSLIEYTSDILSGIPSIVYGLVGMLFFCQFFNLQTSILAGTLTLVIMNIPTIMKTTRESLKTVPNSYREGARALGAGKWKTIHTVVLKSCTSGMITGILLTVGRILGESAALLFTAGFAQVLNPIYEGMFSSGASLSVAMYVFAKERGEFDVAFGIAGILLILTLIISVAAQILEARTKER
ncbi:phosphate ABC transporter permease PstA [Dubosiella newyorkensis]|uniref:phosphate ABC transporter permease PstA n=1 Tax=Dubosiella newyorkensis TaxID=1862672 RepID=UPI0024B90748|nr:phosphate ABC transporter permease PstA [Dubosiella newyorkensis]